MASDSEKKNEGNINPRKNPLTVLSPHKKGKGGEKGSPGKSLEPETEK